MTHRGALSATKPANASGTLIAIEGLGDQALVKSAMAELDDVRRAMRGGCSVWDASGVFGDLVVASDEAGYASARTLLLLYAADLAFRLRWEIRPALNKHRVVVAAPYVATAIAFGRAAGIDSEWLKNLFLFAPRPTRTKLVPATRGARDRAGFVEFVCERLAARPDGPKRRDLRDHIWTELKK
jgi:dTMP kinase